MRDKLIALLSKKYDHFCDQCGINKEAHYIENLADYLIANGVTVNEWRPASEPPKENGEYLTLHKTSWGYTWQDVSKFSSNLCKVDDDFNNEKHTGWFGCNDGTFYEITSVTHWMPLPNAPKGENE